MFEGDPISVKGPIFIMLWFPGLRTPKPLLGHCYFLMIFLYISFKVTP